MIKILLSIIPLFILTLVCGQQKDSGFSIGLAPINRSYIEISQNFEWRIVDSGNVVATSKDSIWTVKDTAKALNYLLRNLYREYDEKQKLQRKLNDANDFRYWFLQQPSGPFLINQYRNRTREYKDQPKLFRNQ